MSAEALEWLRLGFAVMAFLLAAAANIYVYLSTRSAARRADVDKEIDGLTERVATVEADLRHAPTQEQFERVHRDLSDLNGTMRELRGSLNGVKAGMDIIHQHLLNKGGGSDGK